MWMVNYHQIPRMPQNSSLLEHSHVALFQRFLFLGLLGLHSEVVSDLPPGYPGYGSDLG